MKQPFRGARPSKNSNNIIYSRGKFILTIFQENENAAFLRLLLRSRSRVDDLLKSVGSKTRCHKRKYSFGGRNQVSQKSLIKKLTNCHTMVMSKLGAILFVGLWVQALAASELLQKIKDSEQPPASSRDQFYKTPFWPKSFRTISVHIHNR
jgi:hypothetical protein